MARNGKDALSALIETRQARGLIGDLDAQILRERFGLFLDGDQVLDSRPGLVRNPVARQAVEGLQKMLVDRSNGLPTVQNQTIGQYGRGARLGTDSICAALLERLNGNSTTH